MPIGGRAGRNLGQLDKIAAIQGQFDDGAALVITWPTEALSRIEQSLRRCRNSSPFR